MLQDKLRLLFDEFRVDVLDGRRVIVTPVLKPEHRPEGKWTTLDFGRGNEGVEIVDYLGVELAKMELLPNSCSS
jgi:hypothetical protein